MTNFDDYKLAIESLTGGTNTAFVDDFGIPTVMVMFPKLKIGDVIDGGGDETHPAFIVDGVEKDFIYVSKYQNIIANDRAYSLPMKDPAVNINFDRALQVCRNKGNGWHLETNALRAAIALWCKKNGTQPHGNNNYGQDINFPHEKAVPSMALDGSGRVQRTATGSGPVSWYHNYDSSGIADLNGNVWEWVGGMRIVDGEIQIIPYGNAMKLDCNMSATSTEWKAIMPDGTLVNPGTAGTLKWDYTGAPATGAGFNLIAGNLVNKQTTGTPYGNDFYGNVKAAAGVTVPMLLKALGLFPDAPLVDYNGVGRFYFRNNGERLPFRGGSWYGTTNAGVFAIALNNPRSGVDTGVGFRAAHYT